MAQQTAVEWLADKLNKEEMIIYHGLFDMWIKQAKQMEKEQIMKAARQCHFEGVRQSAKTSEEYIEYAEEYYNDTFGNQ